MSIKPEERRRSNEFALRCFGTAYIFERRATPLRVALKILAFSSLAGPLAIGALVIAVGTTSRLIFWAVALAATLSIAQILLSLWSLVSGWRDNLAYYIDSKADNYHLADRYHDLANSTALSDAKWRTEMAVLETMGSSRERLDLRHDISDDEKRMGLRAGLRQYQRECVTCGETPQSLDSSDCSTCGRFKQRRLKWLM